MSNLVKYFRDNVHGDIEIRDKVVYDIINSRFFQRLRRIEQLGGAKYVFLGANHTRFSHCIGVYHIVCKFLSREVIGNHFDAKEKLSLKVSGLLHDIGHGPFSHTFEWLLKNSEIDTHEKYSSKIIREDKEISSILINAGIEPNLICEIIEGKNRKLSPFISSQVDADRIDYLLRDGLLVGVNYGSSDINWMLRNALYVNDKLVFNYKAISSLESYLLGRYHMYKQVYLHKTSIAFDATFLSWYERICDLYNSSYQFKSDKLIYLLKEVIEKKEIPIEKYYDLDDYQLIVLFKECLNEKDDVLKKLSFMLVNRKFLRVCDITEEEFLNRKNSYSNKEHAKYFFKKQKLADVFIYKAKNESEDILITYDNKETKKLNEVSNIVKINIIENNNIKSNNLYLLLKENI